MRSALLIICLLASALAAAETTGTLAERKQRRLAELQAVRQEMARLSMIELKLLGALEELEDQTSATLAAPGARGR